jgi:DNA repair exonuclease SbcCD ATPase subunit
MASGQTISLRIPDYLLTKIDTLKDAEQRTRTELIIDLINTGLELKEMKEEDRITRATMNSEIEAAKSMLAKKDEQISIKDKQIDSLHTQLTSKDNQLTKKDIQIAAKDKQIDSLMRSNETQKELSNTIAQLIDQSQKLTSQSQQLHALTESRLQAEAEAKAEAIRVQEIEADTPKPTFWQRIMGR